MYRSSPWYLLSAVLAAQVVACASGGAPRDERGDVDVLAPDAFDVSAPLTELVKTSSPDSGDEVGKRGREAPFPRRLPHMRDAAGATKPVVDPVVQGTLGAAQIPTPLVSFEGMGSGLPGFNLRFAPPDTAGDIGPDHYVQVVNTGLTIFNRTGGVVLGPFDTRQLWANFPGGCQDRNDGDGHVRYDRYADRWVITQFSVNEGNGPFLQCIAVSTTPNPTGTYARYQFSYPAFNDYPKLALWPDGYYITFNMFSPEPATDFIGGKACAFDRARMLAGQPATMQCFDTAADVGGLLPADVDGPALPPAGSPNYTVALDTNALLFFRFHVDFANPANSTFIGPTTIGVAPFTQLCNGDVCVVQPGTTNRLDSMADRLMNRLVYRNFGSHEALVVSHAVANPAGGGGVRFYELRSPATTPTVFQQGTYAPDTAFRWMSSVAFDGAGNMGLGFSISSSTIRPSIRYTGRLAGDPLGTMGQGEATIITGTGSQTGGLIRWGDYSSINIDPVDDCTFWYTQEYLAANGSFNWRTRVGAFKFAQCGVVINDFTITPNPTSNTVTAGGSVSYAIDTSVLSGDAEPITLSVTGLPAGVLGQFDPTTITAGQSSTLTLTTATTTAAGSTTLTITGVAPTTTHTASASLTVINNNLAPTVSITSPANGTTVSGPVPVTANAADSDGTVASVRFDLPDGSSVTDIEAPFETTWDSSTVANGAGHVIRATATDNLGATAEASVTVTVTNGSVGCIDGSFNATGLPLAIPDNNTTGVTSDLLVVGSGTVTSLSLALNIEHADRRDLRVTLISPGGTQLIVHDRVGPGGEDNVIFPNLPITAFNGETAAGTWRLLAQDTSPLDLGRIKSWSLRIVGTCVPTGVWRGSASPNLPTIDNGQVCSSVTVFETGDAAVARLDISGSHTFRSTLRGTLAHDGVTVSAFGLNTFLSGSGTFAFTNRAVPGFTGNSAGTWTLCVIDTDAFGDTGILNSWSVHE